MARMVADETKVASARARSASMRTTIPAHMTKQTDFGLHTGLEDRQGAEPVERDHPEKVIRMKARASVSRGRNAEQRPPATQYHADVIM